ncbi:HIT family protein [Metabacillus sp. Hm71]|uniref:HIT family protein n=1 Tax=Metabacillus sp. Hm71 TaxID=3450743 RepID=UPI003F43AF78
MNRKMKCLGCSLANKMEAVNVIYENDSVCCILDHDPFNEGHVLILPKQHAEDVDDLNEETANAVIQAARLISKAIKTLYKPDGITICQNGGIFSELTHFHMHVVPRYKHQSFADFYLEMPLDNGDSKKKLLKTRNELAAMITKNNEEINH